LKKAKKIKRKLSNQNRNDIRRKLANKNYIDCDQCEAYECYVDEDDLDDGVQTRAELDEQVSEWIANLAQCQETGVQMDDLDLYVGAMCSPYGDGVELAVFANEECTWYTNQQRYSDVYDPYNDDNEYNVNYLTYAEDFIKSAFNEITPCVQVEYDDPDEDDDGDAEEEERYEANEYCQQVMENDAVSFSNCEADDDEEEEDMDDAWKANYGSWFTYDMVDAEDVEKVCVALNAMESADYSHVYDEEASGTWYRRNKKGVILYGDETEKKGLGGGAIALIAVLVLGVVGAAGFFLTQSKKQKSAETEYQGGEMS